MKYVLIFIIAFSSFFMSCDGRMSRNEALQNAVSEFNGKQARMLSITYFPREYTEIVTDTIIENAVKIRIKNYALMDENVLISSQDNPPQLKYQRRFESDIIVHYASGVLFKIHLNAKTFQDNDHSLFWNNATLEHAWVNQEESNGKNVSIMVSFVNPETKLYRLYQLRIDKTGTCNTSLKENYS